MRRFRPIAAFVGAAFLALAACDLDAVYARHVLPPDDARHPRFALAAADGTVYTV